MSTVQRPDVWVGHVVLRSKVVEASEACMRQVGLRPIFCNDQVAVMELRGGTHLVILADETAEPGEADFDLMVEDLDKSHAEFARQGLAVSDVSRGEIHDSFVLTEPGGNRITVNSSHVNDYRAI